MAWPFHSTHTLKEAVELVAKYAYEKTFAHGNKRKRLIQEFWIYLNGASDIESAVAEARKQFNLEAPDGGIL